MSRAISSDPDKNRDRLKNSISIDSAGCWIWQRAKSSRGYGQIWYGKKSTQAHRLSYQLFVGPIPEGMHICHHCDVPACINPEHLFPGTDRDNALDCVKKGRRPKVGPDRGTCKHAHLTLEQAAIVRQKIATRSGSLYDLAKELGISYYVIAGISNGRNY